MSRRLDYSQIPGGSMMSRRVSIYVCSSSQPSNTQGLVDEIASRFPNQVQDVQYCQLPYNDIDSFSLRNKNIDVMILCHSIHNRRLAITDVLDAIYDKFLLNAARVVGREKICVIGHDFPIQNIDTAEKYSNEMTAFQYKQPTTFRNSSATMIGGKLDSQPVELSQEAWVQLKEFIDEAARQPVRHEPTSLPDQVSKRELALVCLVLSAIAFILFLICILAPSPIPLPPPHDTAEVSPREANLRRDTRSGVPADPWIAPRDPGPSGSKLVFHVPKEEASATGGACSVSLGICSKVYYLTVIIVYLNSAGIENVMFTLIQFTFTIHH